MKKLFISLCILSATNSCHAMLRSLSSLQRTAHIAAQTSTLSKRSMCFDSSAQAATRPIYHERKGECMRLKKLLENAQHMVNRKKQDLQETEADYQKLKMQHDQATEQLRIEYSQTTQLLDDPRDLMEIIPKRRMTQLMRVDEYTHLEALLEKAQYNVNLRKQALQKTEVDYQKLKIQHYHAIKHFEDAICLKNFACSLDAYYDKLQGCFEYHDEKNAVRYRNEITQELAALIKQIEPAHTEHQFEHDELLQENMQPVGC